MGIEKTSLLNFNFSKGKLRNKKKRANNFYCDLKFHKVFLKIVDTCIDNLDILVSWSHYRVLLQIKDYETYTCHEKEIV